MRMGSITSTPTKDELNYITIRRREMMQKMNRDGRQS